MKKHLETILACLGILTIIAFFLYIMFAGASKPYPDDPDFEEPYESIQSP